MPNLESKVRACYETAPFPNILQGTADFEEAIRLGVEWAMLNWRGLGFDWQVISPSTVLCAGCGTGEEAIILSRLFPDAAIHAIDISEPSLLIAMQNAKRALANNIIFQRVSILEDLLLGWKLPVFTRRARRELASHPKFYFFDTGVFRANRPKGPLDEITEIEGPALEGLVAQHLKAWCDYSQGGHALYYWQTRSQVEVDFVIYGESGLFAVEVKNTHKVRPEDLSALKSFGEDYPESQRFLLYRGREFLRRDGIQCIPCELFLRGLKPDLMGVQNNTLRHRGTEE